MTNSSRREFVALAGDTVATTKMVASVDSAAHVCAEFADYQWDD